MVKFTAQEIAERYGGTVALPQECNIYLQEDQQLIFGIHLNDATANYKQLTKYDLMSLSATSRRECLKSKKSPFNNMLLIVFKSKDNETEFKLLHGMASRLITDIACLCEHIAEVD